VVTIGPVWRGSSVGRGYWQGHYAPDEARRGRMVRGIQSRRPSCGYLPAETTLRVYGMRIPERRVTAPLAHKGPVERVMFSRDGRRIVSASAGYVYVWDASGGKVLKQYLLGDFATGASFSPDGSRILVKQKHYREDYRDINWQAG